MFVLLVQNKLSQIHDSRLRHEATRKVGECILIDTSLFHVFMSVGCFADKGGGAYRTDSNS